MIFNCEVIHWNILNDFQKKNILSRPGISRMNRLKKEVEKIIFNVRNFGDIALKKYTTKFDNISLNHFKVPQDRINQSEYQVSSEFKNAILTSFKNIHFFHKQQINQTIDVETSNGVRCQQITSPIESVGLYVPGGTAPLLSTVLMLAIPAQIAGCKNILLCSPPPIINEILYIAKICGLNNIFEVGGAQAIASFAFGTNTIPKVDKVFGPGNAYVTEAKSQLNQLLPNFSIDMAAGPSELLIIADDQSNASFIASDLLSQAEHGIDSQVILLTTSINIIKHVILEINKQILYLSRSQIIIESLKHSKFILTKNLLQCAKISNMYAPEHLIIHIKKPRNLLKSITNAGSIFLGPWSPESVGDYSSGTNHVLPTYGSATYSSGLGLMDFQKRINIQELTYLGLKNLSHIVKSLSLSEKMDAHNNAIQLRIDSIRNKNE
ncbi:histidinol dehydrogenase [Buchnera aphidicola]|uniref:histidinol dehydrogenase n=1 Tax=Buchnera aphidicola TaxID=9 RepID=UPI00346439FB